MPFTATRTASGQYFLFNDETGEHVTVDSADEIKAVIDAYNQGTVDKANAIAEAEAKAAEPQAVPAVDVPGVPPVAVTEAQATAPDPGTPPAPVSNAN